MRKIMVTIPDAEDSASMALQRAVPSFITLRLDDEGLVRIAAMAEAHVPELVKIRRRIEGANAGDVEALWREERQLLHRFAGEVVRAFSRR